MRPTCHNNWNLAMCSSCLSVNCKPTRRCDPWLCVLIGYQTKNARTDLTAPCQNAIAPPCSKTKKPANSRLDSLSTKNDHANGSHLGLFHCVKRTRANNTNTSKRTTRIITTNKTRRVSLVALPVALPSSAQTWRRTT